ncbi:MAG: hypothetical protein FWE21_01240 [Defluviitaleaceae bacterium]|nr:hypothetical protein [Defluviitaleaceae bacterium]
MIYLFMGLSLLLLAVATYFTHRDYRRGKVVRQVFTKMLAITILIAVLMVIVLVVDFAIGG